MKTFIYLRDLGHPDEDGVYTAKASTMGIPPGTWPDVIEWGKGDDRLKLNRVAPATDFDPTIEAGLYRAERGTGLKVSNQ